MKGTVVDGRIAKLFEGKLKNYISCINVEFESSRIEEFKDLSLNVKGCATLYDAFEKCPCPHLPGAGGSLLTSAPGLGSPAATAAPGLGSPAATAAPGPRSFLPHLQRDRARACPALRVPPLFPTPRWLGGLTSLLRTGMPKRRGWRAITSTWRRDTGSKMPPRVSSSQSSRLYCTFRQAARLQTPPVRPALCIANERHAPLSRRLTALAQQ